MKFLTGFMMAWGTFCAIPCPFKRWDEKARRWMVATLPVLGLILGLMWFGLFLILKFLGVPGLLTAAVMTAFPFIITGHIHLDGFMDCSDAILSRKPIEEKQKILKDSHVGAFAVISLSIMLMVFLASMEAIFSSADWGKGVVLIMFPPLTRTMAALDVLCKKPLKSSQYCESYEKRLLPYLPLMAINGLIALVIVCFMAYEINTIRVLPFMVMVVLPFVATGLAGAYGRKELGGMSGDIAGYSIVWGELAGVVALALL